MPPASAKGREWNDETNPLHGLQWELLHGRVAGGPAIPLAIDDTTPFSRFDALGSTYIEPLPRRPLRLLVAVANPSDLEDEGMPAVRVNALLTALLSALGRHTAADRLQVTVLCGQTLLSPTLTANLAGADWAVVQKVTSLDNLQRLAETHDLLYITAHGLRDGAGLILEDNAGIRVDVDAGAIAAIPNMTLSTIYQR